MSITLRPRLRAVADYVRPGARLADIGTDHGYLICALALEGRIPGGLACDIRPGPLSSAQKLMDALGLENRISARLCDGLDGVAPHEADDIAIAGMGGELITALVQRAEWLRSPEKRLILQPQTRAPELRRALYRLGFRIEEERGVRDGRFLYTVLCCRYGGCPAEPETLACYTGALPEDSHPESRDYLLHLAGQLRKQGDGLARSSTKCIESEYYYQLSSQILSLLKEGKSGGQE
ncbi:MAG: SAM-dependent methyltransferase [Provencibacterium sp.]|nr:SAM-dependent methyltransferase [Provencibacterium sp.]